jgi:spore photoproduct lyase
MNSSPLYKGLLTHVFVTKDVAEDPMVGKALGLLSHCVIRIITSKEEIPPESRNQHSLLIQKPKGEIVDGCPGSRGHLCCNYLTINLYEGCTIGCTYCIMKSYLNFSPVTVNLDLERSVNRVLSIREKNPGRAIRIGTGETGDSLLFDPLLDISRHYINAFAPYPEIFFELKTKTSFVDHLLEIKEKGNAVIGFSLNPERIVSGEEGISATLAERLDAASRAVRAGFRVSFHFDPIIRYEGWERDYLGVIDRLKVFPASRVAWISLGTFRYPPSLKDKIDRRWYLYDEFFPCRDSKFRYLHPVRKKMYLSMKTGLSALFPGVPLYLCMESPAVWEYVFGKNPGKIDRLCAIFKSIRINT